MPQRRLKWGYFVLEGLNSFATILYLYYFYFFATKSFGFGPKANLSAAALGGALTAIGSFFGGRFAQRQGYHKALKLGFFVMMAALAVGSQLNTAVGHLCVLGAMVLGMGFTWPALEALVSEGEPAGRLERIIGIYNVVWAGTNAAAFFIGGAILQISLRGIFYVPAAIFLGQLIFLFWLERKQRDVGPSQRLEAQSPASSAVDEGTVHPVLPRRPDANIQKTFVRMSWLANPFAYIAINSFVAVVPTLAFNLGLSAKMAGFVCSVWGFARMGAFVILWHWPRWHYRFGWLLAAYVSLIVGFISILFAHDIFLLVVDQVLFGAALGLIYYSSLFYSMDFSETKGEHGGVHEAAIGAGNFVGPAVGAAALHFFPQAHHSATIAVGACLVGGLAGLIAIWKNAGRR